MHLRALAPLSSPGSTGRPGSREPRDNGYPTRTLEYRVPACGGTTRSARGTLSLPCGSFRQDIHVESVDVLQQFAERLGAVIEQALAFFGGGLRGVPDGTARVKVLRLPGEWRGTLRG